MRHPALMRMLGIFMAVVSLLTVIAGGLGFRGASGDRREQQRQDELLQSRIDSLEELLPQIEALREDYAAAESFVSEHRDAHDRDRSGYRTELGTYTATKAGIVLGRKQLDETAEMLKHSMELFQIGFSKFLEAEEAFQPIWEMYLSVRGAMDQSLEIYGEAAAYLPEDGEDETVSLSPEQALSLAAVEHRMYGELSDLLQLQRAAISPDQRQAAAYLQQALEDYGEIAPELQGFSIERLIYEAGQNAYGQATEAMGKGKDAGLSAEEARSEADRISQESFGMDYDALGEWLEQNEPAPSEDDGQSSELSPEMLATLLNALPNDAALIDTAIGMINDSDQALLEKEDAFRADPHDMSAAALLLSASKEGLDGSERVLGLVAPTILETHDQLQAAHEQLDAAWYALYCAQKELEENAVKLEETADGLDGQLRDLEETRGRLEEEKEKLETMESTVEAFKALQNRFRILRSQLLDDEQIASAAAAERELLPSAKEALEQHRLNHDRELRLRRILCALMVSAGLFGFFTSLGAFEKPRIRRLWLPLCAAMLLAGAGELISFRLGRGLWYTAVFILVFGILMLPLTFGKRKEGSV